MNFLSTELRSFGAVLREKDLSIVVSLDQFNQLPIAIKKTERPKLFHHRVARSPRVFVLLLIFSRSFFPANCLSQNYQLCANDYRWP